MPPNIMIDQTPQQTVQQAALSIAKLYADQDHWTAVALNLRIPFWDWAVSSVPPDEIIALENVNIITPDGKQDVPNPFFQYTFKPIDPSFPSPWNRYQITVRYPCSEDSVKDLKRYDMVLPHSNFTHSFFSTKVNCPLPDRNLPRKHLTFSRVVRLGPLSAPTTPRVATLLTPWKPFMTKFTSYQAAVVTMVMGMLVVSCFTLVGF